MKKGIYLLLSLLAVTFLYHPEVLLAKNTKEKIDEKIDKGAECLKRATRDLQEYLNHYRWKGILEDQIVVGPVTLSNLKVNGQKKGIVLQGGSHASDHQKVEVEVEVTRSADPAVCSQTAHHHLVAGLKGLGPQTVFGSWWGLPSVKQEHETLRFTLEVPSNPTRTVHELRFRHTERLFEWSAPRDWTDERGVEPDASTTLGVIVITE